MENQYIFEFELADGRSVGVIEVRSLNIAYDIVNADGSVANSNAAQSLTHEQTGYLTKAKVETLIKAQINGTSE